MSTCRLTLTPLHLGAVACALLASPGCEHGQGDDDDDSHSDDDGMGGDCSASIPGNAQVQRDTYTITEGGTVVWACSGATITSNGGDNTIFAEEGVSITSNGTGDTIYAKSGAAITVNGSDTLVNHEGGSSVNVYGMGSTAHECAAVSFDLANAPAGGCD